MEDIASFFNPIIPWLLPVLVLFVIGLFAGAIWFVSRGTSISKQRLVAASATGDSAASSKTETPLSLNLHEATIALGKFFSPLGSRLVPDTKASLTELRRRLVRAGYMQPSAVGWYYVTRILLAIGLPTLMIILVPLSVGGLPITVALLLCATSGLLGLYLPPMFISQKTKWMQTNYRNAFPDALDLLLVCVEAGLGLDGAIGRVANEIGVAHPALGTNLKMLESELRAGKSRQDALKSMADRLGIDEARSLVTLLLQSEELGSSISDALRVYSNEMRVKRMLEAERRANALPVKLSIPLVLSVFPVLLIFILLPMVIRIKNAMF